MERQRDRRIRLAAMDLDDTTLRPGGVLSEYTIRALERASLAGIRIVAASGRAFSTLPPAVSELPFLEYAIASNGANTYEVKTGKRVREVILKEEAARRILDIAQDEGLLVEGFIDGTAYSQSDYVADTERMKRSGRNAAYVQSTRKPVDDIFGFLRQARRLDSINILAEDLERRPVVRRRLEEIDGIYLTTSGYLILEVSGVGAGKGPALKELASMLGIGREEIVAFGNAENDIGMLRFAGVGVAVANAEKEVRASADEVTASNGEDGVARWLMRYLGEE